MSLEPAVGVIPETLYKVNEFFHYPQQLVFSKGGSKVSRMASRPTLETPFRACSRLWGSELKIYIKCITACTIHNNMYLAKDAAK